MPSLFSLPRTALPDVLCGITDYTVCNFAFLAMLSMISGISTAYPNARHLAQSLAADTEHSLGHRDLTKVMVSGIPKAAMPTTARV